MVSVLIFCHDKREGAFWGKLCKEYLKFIKEEFVYSFIGDMDYDESYIRGVQSPELIIAEISGLEDLEKVKYIRTRFVDARLLLLCDSQIPPECYVIPEISPDMLLLKPYAYLKAAKMIRKLLSCCYKDRERRQVQGKLLKIRTGGEVYYISYTDICYLEARDKKIIVHMQEEEISFYSSLQKLEGSLPEYFIRCHRSYIVNFMCVKKADLTQNIFCLNKKVVIPISQKYKNRLAKIL